MRKFMLFAQCKLEGNIQKIIIQNLQVTHNNEILEVASTMHIQEVTKFEQRNMNRFGQSVL